MNDAIAGREMEYFLGSIVAIERSPNQLELVDGQQRLTTSAILLAAIRDYFEGVGDRERAEVIEGAHLFTRDLRSLEVRPKLRLGASDNEFFLQHVLRRPAERTQPPLPSQESHRRLLAAARAANEHVAKLVSLTHNPADILLNWVDFTRDQGRVILVVVPDESNAFVIFETLNDRGLDLAVSDLLKNYLFAKSGDRIGETQDRWTSMVAALESSENENITLSFLRHFWSSRNGVTREKELYKEIRNTIDSKEKAVSFAQDCVRYSRNYIALLNPDHEIWPASGNLRTSIETLNMLGSVQVRPLLLSVLERFGLDNFDRPLKMIVNAVVRFLVVGGGGAGTLEKLYCELAQKISRGAATELDLLRADLRRIAPNDVEFEKAFATFSVSKSDIARYYLRSLEERVSQTGAELLPNSNPRIVNLEHILPQRPSASWNIDADEARALTKRLGNMVLMLSSDNVTAANSDFDTKRSFYAQSGISLTRQLAEYTLWDEDSISQRQRQLAGIAIKVWAI